MKRDDYDPEIGGYYDEENGEKVWYIGHQAFVGRTDDECCWSEQVKLSKAELRRIMWRHHDALLATSLGVNAIGLGKGISIGLDPEYAHNIDLFPTSLDGVSVEVFLAEPATFESQDSFESNVCCLNFVENVTQSGDSGALVAYSGSSRRWHIAGVHSVKRRSSVFKNGVHVGYKYFSGYVPANDIKEAFSNAGVPFNHFWGSRSEFREPSTRSE